jgi:pilus assembly protein Flp/PilA
MKQQLIRFWRDESGATSIEYGLIAAGIGVAVITLIGQAGDDIQNIFGQLKDQLIDFNGSTN